MYYICTVLIVLWAIQLSVAPPVTHNKKEGDQKDADGDMENVMEYHRYLKEVIQALESDTDFRAKLVVAQETDIRTGKIAHELEHVNHKVRTRLDELKRDELERLRHLAAKEHNLVEGYDLEHLKIAEHLDHSNTRTFEINDLKKLISKTTKDLAEADQKRREEFKEYEMQKKFDEQQKLQAMPDEERKRYEAELQKMKEQHKKHEPLHHPGSKQQLQEVWDKQDHMDSQEFNPKTFFYLHDLDGNRLWDQNEVKALFLKELDKLYAEGAPEDDLVERAEEMERMREHMFNEVDRDKDGFISYEEFLDLTKNPNFQQDPEWQGLDTQEIYSSQEYEAFARNQAQQHMQGKIPPQHPNSIPVHHEQFPPQYMHVPAQQGAPPHEYPGMDNRMPNHVAPQHQGQPMQQHPPQQMHIPQHPPQQMHIPQHPPQQMHIPQHPQQMSQQQHPQQVHVAQQQHQGQVPVQQLHNQVPVQQHYEGQVQQQNQGQAQQQPQYNVLQQTQNHPPDNQQQPGHIPAQQPNIQNQIPQHQNAQGSAAAHPNSGNQVPQQAQQSQSPQAPIQQQIHHNSIPVAGKA